MGRDENYFHKQVVEVLTQCNNVEDSIFQNIPTLFPMSHTLPTTLFQLSPN